MKLFSYDKLAQKRDIWTYSALSGENSFLEH